MKRNLVLLMLLAIACLIAAAPAAAQTATVQGVCKDAQGNPIVDGQVLWHNQDNGRNYTLKTNKKGQYFSLGIEPGKYKITLSKDGKELDSRPDFEVGVDEVTLDFDVKKSQEQAIADTAKQRGMTTEQVKKVQEEAAKAEAYNKNIGAVNEKLKAASAAEQANPPNYDVAIASLSEASQMAPNEDLVWYRLGKAYLDSTKTQTDAGEKTKRYTEAYNDIQKAIDLEKPKASSVGGQAPANGQGAPAAPAQGAKPAAQGAAEQQKLAAYYDNFGAAASKVGKNDEAANAYKQAAELDPTHAAHYYTNLGITLMNGGDSKGSAEAFDKAIASDPSNALAYYFKGQSLFSGVTTDASGKMTAPAGTAEALNKYLELQPNGPYSQSAKDMLAALGTKVETSFGSKKKTK